jgi:DNA mismatch repair protein MutL
MTRIRVLDAATVNRIAAGEVIERPASVVKELLENSLDAGAAAVHVRVSRAGKEMIEVADDGCGMAEGDLALAFLQHATSKLGSIDDLDRIRTMGFRGEALASIAAVADVEMSTRERAEDAGHAIAVIGGRAGEARSIGRPGGTTVTVRNLFMGHPARLKYLKSDKVEMSHIVEAVAEHALVNPGTAFTLHADGSEVLSLPRCGSVKDRIGDVMGIEVARALDSFTAHGAGFGIAAYLARPEVTRSTRSGLHIYINSRPVSSAVLADAVEAGYEGMLMRGRHPVGVLMLEVDPAKVDVNVHPTKRTVRLSEEKQMAVAISGGARQMLAGASLIREAEPARQGTFPVSPGAPPKGRGAGAAKETVQSRLSGDAPGPAEVQEGRTMPAMRVVGQILDTYILAESGTDLLIIDQHAAHERVMLDLLRKRPARRAGQKLITPVPLKVGGKEAQLIEHHRQAVEDLGFTIEPFGKDTYLVRAVPSIGGHIETERGLLDLVRELAEIGKAKSLEDMREEMMHLVACHSAIRAGETLTMQQMMKLVEEMKSLDNPYSCAHGRPTIIRITGKELEKMFKRVV